jgi:oligopeptide transport system ATP-binding protein
LNIKAPMTMHTEIDNEQLENRSIALVKVDNLHLHFQSAAQALFDRNSSAVRAVDGVTLGIIRGETLGLVGESGCGKTTLGRTAIGLLKPTKGRVLFDGKDIHHFKGKELKAFRQRVQIIFQDPFGSLHPRMSIGWNISEPLRIHGLGSPEERSYKVEQLLDRVGLNPAFAQRYPHEFSGGQQQRVGIARALASNPDFIVCDEPVSALDVSIQAQVINLLQDLQQDYGLTYLFIAHDLRVVRHISNRVAVMYLGRIVEIAQSDTLYEYPNHPYTRALLSAVPIPNPDVEEKRQRIIIEGDLPTPVDPPAGCGFHPRCPFAQKKCIEEVPVLQEISPGQFVACHFWETITDEEWDYSP